MSAPRLASIGEVCAGHNRLVRGGRDFFTKVYVRYYYPASLGTSWLSERDLLVPTRPTAAEKVDRYEGL